MQIKRPQIQVYIVLAIVTILVGVGFWYFPWLSDDIGYRLPFKDYFVYGQPVELSRLWDHFIDRCTWDNGRLATLAMIFIEFTPHFMQVLCSSAAMWIILWYGLKLIGKRDSVVSACVWSFLLIVFLPWVDQMYVFDFQVAYLWGAAFAVVLSYILLYQKGSMTGVVLMSLLVGLWQEAFGFPLFIGLVAMWLIKRDKRIAIACLCLLVGLTWLYFAPGGQAYRGTDWRPFSFRSNIINIFALPTIILIITAGIDYVRNRRIGHLLLFVVINAVISSSVMVYAEYGPRVGFWGVYMSLAGFMYIALRFHVGNYVKRIIAICLLIFTSVHLVVVDAECIRLRRDYDNIIAQSRIKPDETIFVPMVMRENAPLICMQKPYFGAFSHYNTMKILSLFYLPDGKFIRAVPKELQEYREGCGKKVPGNMNIIEYKGYLVGECLDEKPAEGWLYIDYGKGRVYMPIFICPFTDADGIKRSWYSVNTSTIQALFTPVPVEVSYKEL